MSSLAENWSSHVPGESNFLITIYGDTLSVGLFSFEINFDEFGINNTGLFNDMQMEVSQFVGDRPLQSPEDFSFFLRLSDGENNSELHVDNFFRSSLNLDLLDKLAGNGQILKIEFCKYFHTRTVLDQSSYPFIVKIKLTGSTVNNDVEFSKEWEHSWSVRSKLDPNDLSPIITSRQSQLPVLAEIDLLTDLAAYEGLRLVNMIRYPRRPNGPLEDPPYYGTNNYRSYIWEKARNYEAASTVWVENEGLDEPSNGFWVLSNASEYEETVSTEEFASKKRSIANLVPLALPDGKKLGDFLGKKVRRSLGGVRDSYYAQERYIIFSLYFDYLLLAAESTTFSLSNPDAKTVQYFPNPQFVPGLPHFELCTWTNFEDAASDLTWGTRLLVASDEYDVKLTFQDLLFSSSVAANYGYVVESGLVDADSDSGYVSDTLGFMAKSAYVGTPQLIHPTNRFDFNGTTRPTGGSANAVIDSCTYPFREEYVFKIDEETIDLDITSFHLTISMPPTTFSYLTLNQGVQIFTRWQFAHRIDKLQSSIKIVEGSIANKRSGTGWKLGSI